MKSRLGKKVLVTGSSGLIGSEAVKFFANLGFQVIGIDNDMRRYFFGDEASTKWNRDKLKKEFKDKYIHYNVDIRDNKKFMKQYPDFKLTYNNDRIIEDICRFGHFD